MTTQETGPTRTPRSEIAAVIPAARRESVGVEPVLLWDRSTSTMWSTYPDGPDYPDKNSRRYVMTGAIRQVVTHLDGLDAEEAAEQSSGSDEMGGLLTFWFGSTSTDGHDLNPANFDRKLQEQDKAWGGSTHIMAAWNQALDEYEEEFGDKPERERPVHLVLVATDGELDDMDEFQHALQTASSHRVFVVMIFGADGDGDDRHSKTLAQYTKEAERQKAADPHGKSYVRIISFDGDTDPKRIAEDMVTLVS